TIANDTDAILTAGSILADNTYITTVNCTDGSGHTGNSTAITIIVDTSNPFVTIVNPVDGINHSSGDQAFNATVTNGALQIDTVLFEFSNGTMPFNRTAANISGNWNLNLDLSSLIEDTHTVRVYANDTLNNMNSTETITIHVDRTAPVVNVYNTSYNSTDTTPSVSFNFTDLSASSNCTLYMNGAHVDSATIANDTDAILTAGSILADNTYITTVNCTDGSGHTGNSTAITITIDTTDPVIYLYQPADDSWEYDDGVIPFTYYAIDDNLDACTLYGNFSGAWLANQTNMTVTNGNAHTVLLTLPDGHYVWNVLCNDSAKNSAFNITNRTIKVDTTAPLVKLSAPADDSWDNDGLISFDYQAADPNLDACVLWGNFSNLWAANETNMSAADSATGSFTILIPDGHYKWNIQCNDTFGKSAFNETNRTIKIDTNVPTVYLNSPLDDSWDADGIVPITYIGVNDNLDACTLYGNFSGIWAANETNMTVTSASAHTVLLTLPDGHYVWNVWCNISSGNSAFNSTNYTIKVDTTDPVVNLNAPADDSWQNSIVSFTYLATDMSLDECALYGNFSGAWTANETNTTPTSGSADTVTLTLPDGHYVWNVLCNDSVAKSAFNSTNYTIKVDSAAPTWDQTPANATLEYAIDHLNIDFNATDTNTISQYFVNDTTNFNITLGGELRNKTLLTVKTYIINVSVNDSSNNVNSIIYQVDVEDNTKPQFNPIPTNQETNYSKVFGYQITGTDNAAVDDYTVNDTANFKINSTGYLANNTVLSIGTYSLLITVNDTSNNLNTTTVSVAVKLTNTTAITENTSVTFDFSEADSNITLYLGDDVTTTIKVTTGTASSAGTTAALIGLKAIDIEVDNNTGNNLTWALIKLYYTQAELTAANIDESTLKMYYYNTTAADWQLEPNQGVDQASDYVWANATHFSLFGLFGSAPSGGGSTGGGGGGGGSTILGIYSISFTNTPTQSRLKQGNMLKFAFNGMLHTIKATSVKSDSVALLIASKEQTITLAIGEYSYVDLDGDGIDDLYLSLDNIKSGRAYVTTRMIYHYASSVTKEQLINYANMWAEGRLTKAVLINYANIWAGG
ncbi:MAG: hypothetical protein KJ601_08370, partial [Nanoarchaeota archaeon]|nr:hypothetical protein [Nanoarchaeota archaeon]